MRPACRDGGPAGSGLSDGGAATDGGTAADRSAAHDRRLGARSGQTRRSGGPLDGGTRIRQEFRILSMAAWADRVVAALLPAHRDRMAALEADLHRLGDVARREAVRGNGG